jgi:hypothetical protein
MNQPRTLALLAIVFIGITLRLAPHAPNFTPLLAIGLFAGRYISKTKFRIAAPLIALFITDIYVVGYKALPQLSANIWPAVLMINAVVYLAITGSALIGKHATRWTGATGSVIGVVSSSVLFFLSTNLASWIAFYDHSGTGLVTCFTAALPYFWNTLASTGMYYGIFVAALAIIEKRYPTLQECATVLTAKPMAT